MEEIRTALFLAMFAVLGWCDLRTREVDTRAFIIFGGLGTALYVFDWHEVTQFTILMMAGTALGTFALWRIKLFGTGDLFAVFAGTAIYPVYTGMAIHHTHADLLPVMLLVLMGGWALSFIFTILWNVVLNASDVMRRGGIFGEITDSRARKCMAFFILHRQREFERHTFPAEETTGNRRRLKFGLTPPGQEFTLPGTTRYVECASPLMLFSAVAAFVLLAEQLLSTWAAW